MAAVHSFCTPDSLPSCSSEKEEKTEAEEGEEGGKKSGPFPASVVSSWCTKGGDAW